MKCVQDILIDQIRTSYPSRDAWIEIGIHPPFCQTSSVVSFTGCVD
ncbi:hypothetical protein [Megasphaera cerevisiae]